MIIHVVGARPNFMKLGPLVRSLNEKGIESKICLTGQHYDYNMTTIFQDELGLPTPNWNLNIMGGSHAQQTAKIMIAFEELLLTEQPNAIVVYGDVNSTLAAVLVAKKLHIAVIHVE